MAIYSISVSSIGRSKHAVGTAGAHLRYITRESAAVAVLGGNMPVDPELARVWLDDQETSDRKNARIVTKLTLALPIELSHHEHRKLVSSFSAEVTRGRASWFAAIHRPSEQGDQRNVHAHVVVRDRDPVSGKTVCGMSDRGSVVRLREIWERRVNASLEQANIDARVDRRSLANQGVVRRRQIHVGVIGTAIQRNGRFSDRADINAGIIERNFWTAQRVLAEKELADLDRQIEASEFEECVPLSQKTAAREERELPPMVDEAAVQAAKLEQERAAKFWESPLAHRPAPGSQDYEDAFAKFRAQREAERKRDRETRAVEAEERRRLNAQTRAVRLEPERSVAPSKSDATESAANAAREERELPPLADGAAAQSVKLEQERAAKFWESPLAHRPAPGSQEYEDAFAKFRAQREAERKRDRETRAVEAEERRRLNAQTRAVRLEPERSVAPSKSDATESAANAAREERELPPLADGAAAQSAKLEQERAANQAMLAGTQTAYKPTPAPQERQRASDEVGASQNMLMKWLERQPVVDGVVGIATEKENSEAQEYRRTDVEIAVLHEMPGQLQNGQRETQEALASATAAETNPAEAMAQEAQGPQRRADKIVAAEKALRETRSLAEAEWERQNEVARQKWQSEQDEIARYETDLDERRREAELKLDTLIMQNPALRSHKRPGSIALAVRREDLASLSETSTPTAHLVFEGFTAEQRTFIADRLVGDRRVLLTAIPLASIRGKIEFATNPDQIREWLENVSQALLQTVVYRELSAQVGTVGRRPKPGRGGPEIG